MDIERSKVGSQPPFHSGKAGQSNRLKGWFQQLRSEGERSREPHLDVGEWIELGHLCFEKCELQDAKACFDRSLEIARTKNNPKNEAEAIVGLLRVAGESLDEQAIGEWDKELERLLNEFPQEISSSVWYCKGSIALIRQDWRKAQRFFHRYLKEIRMESARVTRKSKPLSDSSPFDLHTARALAMLANTLQQRGVLDRAEWLSKVALKRYGGKRLRGIDGVLHVLLGRLQEKRGRFSDALNHYQKAHSSYLREHNWYHHLYVLQGYARLARFQKNFKLAQFYLDLIDSATLDSGFDYLRRELQSERERLEGAIVDLWIDAKKGLVKTREGGEISLRKQYILMDILKALSRAHGRDGSQGAKGLSKAEIIQEVWRDRYRPEAHDNKLYYNINRLRRLIEPNVREPKYLLNWKEGYRLAPDLRIHYEGEESDFSIWEH